MSVSASQPSRRHIALAVLALGVLGVVWGTTAVGGAVGASEDSWASTLSPTEEVGTTDADADADAAANRTLVVADADSGERLLELPVTDGDEVTLSYTHSVEKTPVEDVYVVDGTDLSMDRTVFSSFGAGLPSDAEMNRTEDGYVVSVDRSFERVHVVPGSVAGHVLVVDDRCYDLVEHSGGSTVAVFVDDRSTAASEGGTRP